MMKKRRIAVITGTRAEYGYLFPILEKIRSDRSLELQLIVTGMHLSKEHGLTYKMIERDGFKIKAKVQMDLNTDKSEGMAKALGIEITGIAKVLSSLKPDIVVIFGDRLEAFAGAAAAAYMNIATAHIHGGDRSKGDIDERVRHAITKLAHIHFPATEKSRTRIIKLGERPDNVFKVGSSTVDSLKSLKYKSKAEVMKELGFWENDYILILQNPVTTEPEESGRQMTETVKAVKAFDNAKVVIEPNSDAGYKGIKKALQKINGSVRIFTNLKRMDYLSLLKHAAVLVGNSSSGIIEAPYFKVPVVNIGIRQQGREKSTNIIDAKDNAASIKKAVQKALSDTAFAKKVRGCKNLYGDGRSAERITKILKNIKITKSLLQKQITY